MEVKTDKIVGLEDLVSKYINHDKKIVETVLTPLTAPGENFGSTILKVDLVLKGDDGKTEPLCLVAKMLPQGAFFQMVFNVLVTFKLESAFYEVVVPTLQSFQRQQGVKDVIDFFPNFYGYRNNLNGGEEVDSNAVLLMENLKTSGFQNLDRHIGCDLQATKLILSDLAKFHAVPLALKLLQPETFENKVKKYMSCFNPKKDDTEGPPSDQILAILDNDECKPLIHKMKKSIECWKPNNVNYREPFATLSHKDMWVNNFMVKIENGRVVKNKFVDFQGYTYESPVCDLLFFLFTSIEEGVLKSNLDELLKFYHQVFIETLEELHCPTKDFSFDKMMDEIQCYGIYELFHILFMLIIVVFGKKGGEASEDGKSGEPPVITKEQIPLKVRERACWTLLEFERRKWLQT